MWPVMLAVNIYIFCHFVVVSSTEYFSKVKNKYDLSDGCSILRSEETRVKRIK